MTMRNLSYQIVRIAFAALALLATAAILDPLTAGGFGLAYSSTVNADIDKIWRKVQGKLVRGYRVMAPEFRWMKQFGELELDASLREMTFPVQLGEDRNIHMTQEGGRKAHPSSINAVDATVTLCHAQGRFTAAFLAKWASMADGGRGEIKKQITFQGMTKVEAMGRHLSDQFYGSSTGVMAQLDGDPGSSAASHTLVLKNAYGWTGISGSAYADGSDAAYIARLFKVGDQVALVRSNALVTNAVGTVTAVDPSVPDIDVDWIPGNVDPQDGDNVVFANATAPGTWALAHTGYNLHLQGLQDFCIATSCQGISSSVEANWSVAHADTDGGRFNGERWRKIVDEIHNYGDENAKPITIIDQGVRRDLVNQYSAGVRFSDTFDLEIDGDPKGQGRSFRDPLRAPPGSVFMFDASKGAIKKKTIHDDVSAPSWPDGFEAQDDNFWVFEIDWAGLTATTNRKLFGYATGLDRIG